MPTTEFKVGDIVQFTKKELAGSVGIIVDKGNPKLAWQHHVRFIVLVDPDDYSNADDDGVEFCDSDHDGFKLLCHAEDTDDGT